MVLSVILLALWGLEFISSDVERGWVSGKNYLMLAVNGLFFGYLVSRYSVREGKTNMDWSNILSTTIIGGFGFGGGLLVLLGKKG